MKVSEVVEKVLSDPAFAEDLAAKVSQITASGTVRNAANDDSWREVLSHFADDPDELGRLLDDVNSPVIGTAWTTTVTSVATTTATPTSPITVTSITTITTTVRVQ
jgi:hypothetical protein